MRLTNEDWKYKIINASPTRLVIVTYEIIIDRLEAAVAALDKDDVYGFRANLASGREFITEMASSLDMRAPVSISMMELYLFANKLISKAYFSQDIKLIDSAETIIRGLKEGLEKEVNDALGGFAAAEASGNYSPALSVMAERRLRM